VLVEANDRYVLGRPRLDLVEVRFIADGGTLAANILAGVVELTLATTLALDEGLQVRDQWRDGRMEVSYSILDRVNAQFVNPHPAVILEAPFRRALLHAIDRQEMVDTLQAGLSSVAVTLLLPLPENHQLEEGARRYPYDPRAALELIQGLGYTRGSDGFFSNADHQRLSVELRTLSGDARHEKNLHAVSGYWQRVGVGVEPVIIPRARVTDREYISERPGFYVVGGSSDLEGLKDLHSARAPVAANGYVGSNNARYRSPAYDALLERYLGAIGQRERREALAEVLRHIADQLPILPRSYSAEPYLVAHRITNVGSRTPFGTQGWNAHVWELQ
jgi:peptide/nickel transport system substrate-binding protein